MNSTATGCSDVVVCACIVVQVCDYMCAHALSCLTLSLYCSVKVHAAIAAATFLLDRRWRMVVVEVLPTKDC